MSRLVAAARQAPPRGGGSFFPLTGLCRWAGWNGRTRDLKAHLVYDPDADRPVWLEITAATLNDAARRCNLGHSVDDLAVGIFGLGVRPGRLGNAPPISPVVGESPKDRLHMPKRNHVDQLAIINRDLADLQDRHRTALSTGDFEELDLVQVELAELMIRREQLVPSETP